MTSQNGPWAEATGSFFSQEEVDQWAELQFAQEEVKCECGAEKVYGPQCTHSDWCPKAES